MASLFSNRKVLLFDAGSLTAQSASMALTKTLKANPDTKILTEADAMAGVMVFFASFIRMGKEYGLPLLTLDRYPVRKLNIYPKYKHKRFERYAQVRFDKAAGITEVPEGEELSLFQQFRQFLLPIIYCLPSINIYANGEEADDCLSTAAHQIGRVTKSSIRVFTRDTDMFQLVDEPRIYILYKRANVAASIITATDVFEKYGVRPDQVPLFKSFLGDGGDSIPNVPGMHAPYIMRDVIGNRKYVHEVFEDYYSGVIDTSEWRSQWIVDFEEHLGIIQGTGQAFINERLATLHKDVNIVYEYSEGNWHEFNVLYSEFLAKTGKGTWSDLDAMSVWNYYSQAAHELFEVFTKDQITLSPRDITAKMRL